MIAHASEEAIDNAFTALSEGTFVRDLQELLRVERVNDLKLVQFRKEVSDLETEDAKLDEILSEIETLTAVSDKALEILNSVCGPVDLASIELDQNSAPEGLAQSTPLTATSSKENTVDRDSGATNASEDVDPWADMDEKPDLKFWLPKPSQAWKANSSATWGDTWGESNESWGESKESWGETKESWDETKESWEESKESWGESKESWSKSKDSWKKEPKEEVDPWSGNGSDWHRGEKKASAWSKANAWTKGEKKVDEWSKPSNAWGDSHQKTQEDDIEQRIKNLRSGYFNEVNREHKFFYWSDSANDYVEAEWDPSLGSYGWWPILWQDGRGCKDNKALADELEKSKGSSSAWSSGSSRPKSNKMGKRDDASWSRTQDTNGRHKAKDEDPWSNWVEEHNRTKHDSSDMARSTAKPAVQHSPWHADSVKPAVQHSTWQVPERTQTSVAYDVSDSEEKIRNKISNLRSGKWTKHQDDFMFWDKEAMDFVGCDWDASINWWKYLWHEDKGYYPADLADLLEQQLQTTSADTSTSNRNNGWTQSSQHNGDFGSQPSRSATHHDAQNHRPQGDALFQSDPWGQAAGTRQSNSNGAWPTQLGASQSTAPPAQAQNWTNDIRNSKPWNGSAAAGARQHQRWTPPVVVQTEEFNPWKDI